MRISCINKWTESLNKIVDGDGIQFFEIVLVLLLAVDEGRQHSRFQIYSLIGCQFTIVYFAEVDIFSILKDFNCSDQITLVLIVTAQLLSNAQSSFDSHALSPAVICIFDPFVQIFIQFRERHFRCIDSSQVSKRCFEQKWFILRQQLIDGCQSLFDQLPSFRRFSNTILLVVESSENVSAHLVIENPLQTDFGVFQRCAQFDHYLLLEERNARPREAVGFQSHLHIFMQSQILQIIVGSLKHFFFTQNRQILRIVLIICKYLQCQFLMLNAERQDLRRHDSFVVKMGIAFTFALEEPLLLGQVVDGEEISDSGMFEDGFLILLLAPVVAAIELVLLVEKILGGYVILHRLLIMIINV